MQGLCLRARPPLLSGRTAANGVYIDKFYPFTVDNTPAVTLTVADAEGDMEVHGSVDFKENITGAEGTVALYIQYDVYGSYWYHQGSKTYEGATPIDWTWEEITGHILNAGTLPQGKATIIVRTTAANGVYIDKFYPFTVDNTPAVTLTVADAEGDMEVHGSVDFKENITGAEGTVALYIQYDVYGSYWYHQGSKTYEGATPIDWTWEEITGHILNAGTLPQGKATIIVRTTAANGVYIDKFYPFTVDNTPAVTLTVADAEGDMEVHGSADFKENITGAEGTVALYIQYDVYGSYWYHQGSKTYEGATPIDWTWEEITGHILNAGTLPQGKATIIVRTTAANGVYIDKFYPFTVDNTPAVTLTVADAEGDMEVHGSADFKENITGAEGTVALYIQYDVYGSYWYHQGSKTYEGATPIDWTWEEITGHILNAGTLPQGKATIIVRTTAANGIYIDKFYPFTIDNTPKPTIDGTQEFPDNTTDIFGTVLFKDNNDGNPTTPDFEGTVTVYLASDAKSPTFSQQGVTKSYEGTSINWKYSDFTGSRLPRDVWGRREYLIKVVATAANGATATEIHNPMIPALGPPSCN